MRPSALGDVCRTVPVLAALRAAHPEARIDWLVRDAFADAVRAHPALDGVVPFPRSAFAHAWRHPGRLHDLLGWLGALRRARYDLVVDAQGLGRSGFFAWCTRAPRRIGPANAREFGWLGYTERVRVAAGLHAVDAMMSLLRPLGVATATPDLRLHVPTMAAEDWSRRAVELGIDPDRAVALAPTARWASKRWPIERWLELARALDADGRRVLILGAPGEEAAVRPLVDDMPGAVDLVGRTDVGGMMAVIARAALVVANDSAALHMAVGFARPLVALFGPTNAALVGPYGRPESVLQHVDPGDLARRHYRDARLGDDLMRRIPASAAIAAARRALDELRTTASDHGDTMPPGLGGAISEPGGARR